MKKMVLAVLAVGALMIAIAFASTTAEDWNFGGLVNFDNGCIWKIKGTTVTATAAEINTLHTGSTYTNAGTLQVGGSLITKSNMVAISTDVGTTNTVINASDATLNAAILKGNSPLAANTNWLGSTTAKTIGGVLTITNMSFTVPYTTNVLNSPAGTTNSFVVDAKGLIVTLSHNP